MNLLFTITFFGRPAFAVAGFVLLSFLSLTAQPSDTIVPNPKAVTLHNIWKVTGKEEGDQVGAGIGSVGFINDDSLTDFAYRSMHTGYWYVFFGGKPAPDTIPDWIWEEERSSGELSHPVVGDFRGDRRHFVGFQSYRRNDPQNSSDVSFLLYFYRVEQETIRKEAELTWDPATTIDSTWRIYSTDMFGANLDNVVGDEFIVVSSVQVRAKQRSQVGEIWIYAGGPEFQVDTPTLIIRDQEENATENQYDLHMADFDGDTYSDMLLETTYNDGGKKFKFWFGSAGSPWDWTETPDRVILVEGTGLNTQPVVADFDGDHIADIAATVYGGDTAGIYVYRSGSGKDFRTRSFAREDADNVLRTNTSLYRAFGPGIGYLNDSSRTYATLPLIFTGFDRFDNSEMLLLSGGKNGPNATFDARYRPDLDGISAGRIFRHMSPLPDCNGDGWDDFLTGSFDWYGFNHGIALVLAGGPEIPNDDPTVSVREEPVAGESGGLYLWPNPAINELNIAWRGNLKRMPARFEVHDMIGRRVASGQVDPSVGAAVWSCAAIASRSYLLTAYDETDTVIASVRIAKQ